MMFLLKDMEERTIDAVIISKTSTAEEIQSAIDRAREIEDYQWDDIVEALPDDCEIISSSEMKTVIY